MWDAIGATSWVLLVASVVLTVRALATGSWRLMYAAACCSAPFGLLSMGAPVFVLPALQALGAAAMERRTARW